MDDGSPQSTRDRRAGTVDGAGAWRRASGGTVPSADGAVLGTMNGSMDPDAADADAARDRLRTGGIVQIEVDPGVRAMLAPGEQVVAARYGVSLERRAVPRPPQGRLRGDLYVTTSRLLHVGPVRIEYPVTEICEAVVARQALRLAMTGSRGIEIGVRDPRVLRVEIAGVRVKARAAARALGAGGTASPQDRTDMPLP